MANWSLLSLPLLLSLVTMVHCEQEGIDTLLLDMTTNNWGPNPLGLWILPLVAFVGFVYYVMASIAYDAITHGQQRSLYTEIV
jgi:hypothetical protein